MKATIEDVGLPALSTSRIGCNFCTACMCACSVGLPMVVPFGSSSAEILFRRCAWRPARRARGHMEAAPLFYFYLFICFCFHLWFLHSSLVKIPRWLFIHMFHRRNKNVLRAEIPLITCMRPCGFQFYLQKIFLLQGFNVHLPTTKTKPADASHNAVAFFFCLCPLSLLMATPSSVWHQISSLPVRTAAIVEPWLLRETVCNFELVGFRVL